MPAASHSSWRLPAPLVREQAEQLDALGKRLAQADHPAPDDLARLSALQREFTAALDQVLAAIGDALARTAHPGL